MILDEQSLLQQPDDSYMDDAQLAFFDTVIRNRRNELALRIRKHEESISESEQVADAADASTIEENRTLTMRIIARERAELMALDAALERIKDDSFGYCEETGLPIGLQRLLINPGATLTIDAQTRLEQRQRHMRA